MLPRTTLPKRGFPAPVFKPFSNQSCPYCGGSNWQVGRASAECGFCEAVLPFARVDALS